MLRMREISFRQSLTSEGSLSLNLSFRPFKVWARLSLGSPIVADRIVARAVQVRPPCLFCRCLGDTKAYRSTWGYLSLLSLLGQYEDLQQ